MYDTPNALYSDPGVVYPIHDNALAFSAYAAQCKEIVSQHRVDLNSNAQTIIAANSPFELSGSNQRLGAVVLHGLLDSPFIMRDLSNHLNSLGITVRAHLLPGHGTVPGGLLNVSFEEWLQAGFYGLQDVSKTFEEVIIVGFSTGATVALYHALQHTIPNLKKLILISPALQLYSKLAFATPLAAKLAKKYPWASWFCKSHENDYARYQSITFNAAYQVYALTKMVKRLSVVSKLQYPMFIAQSMNDKTVSCMGAMQYFMQHCDQDSRFLLYTKNDSHFEDKRFIVRPNSYPQWNIKDISHVALPTSPDNPHYGRQGDYELASVFDENDSSANKFIYGTEDVQSRLKDMLNINRGCSYRRLTYNPDFEFLTQAITDFLS